MVMMVFLASVVYVVWLHEVVGVFNWSCLFGVPP